jgi:hypothetical protein
VTSDFASTKPQATPLAPRSPVAAKPASKKTMGLDSALLDLGADEAKAKSNRLRDQK